MQKQTVVIQSTEDLAQDIYLMRLECPELLTEPVVPGQFVHIALPQDNQHILPRPISIMDVDKTAGTMDLAIAQVGHGTRLLRNLLPGSRISLLGPLGRGFSPGDARSIYFVGGGMGVAPIRFAAQTFSPDLDNARAFFGYRSQTLSYACDASCPTHLLTDDGTLGEKGYVTEKLEMAMEEQLPDLVMACGPTPMLRSIQKICLFRGVGCQLSLEEHMACGIGACLVCSCRVRIDTGSTYKRVCTDGPVFDAREVVFDAY